MPETPRLTPPPIWILAFGAAAGPMAVTLIAPAVPLIRESLRIDGNTAQLILTMLLVSMGVGQLLAGPLSDRIGRRPVFLAGTALFGLAGAIAAFSDSMTMLILCRILQGFGAAASIAMARSTVGDIFTRQEAAKAMSTITAMMAVVPVLGTALGGIVADTIGWEGAFLVLATSGLILFAAVSLKVEETHHHREAKSVRQTLAGYLTLFRSPMFVACSLTTALQTAVFFSLMGFIAYSFDRMGIPAAIYGLWMSATSGGYVLGNILNRRLLARHSLETLTWGGGILSISAMVFMLILHTLMPMQPIGLALPMFIMGIANGAIIANTIIGASGAIPALRGTATGLVGALQMACGGIAGTLAIALGADTNTSIGILVLIGIGCCSAIPSWFLYRGQRSASGEGA